MIETWLNEVIGDFGRQMGLNHFALNERGTAGLRFENGLSLRLEYANGALMMMVGFPPSKSESADAFAVKILTSAHYAGEGAKGVRAGYLSRANEAILVKRIPERSIDVPQLEASFSLLWQTAREIGGVQ